MYVCMHDIFSFVNGDCVDKYGVLISHHILFSYAITVVSRLATFVPGHHAIWCVAAYQHPIIKNDEQVCQCSDSNSRGKDSTLVQFHFIYLAISINPHIKILIYNIACLKSSIL